MNEPIQQLGSGDAADESDSEHDRRLYIPSLEGWGAHLKTDSEKVYCYSKHPGEDFYHRISRGEVYVQRDHEKYCIECALKLGFLTNDRLFWQRRR